MPVLHINDQQYPLKAGSTRLGAPDVAEVPVASVGVQAIVEVDAGRGATIRRAADDASVRVNGVALGVEPTPLLHGDRVEIAGVQIRYADDEKGGATQFVTAGDVAELAARRGGAVATSGTGGRLVSLVDGKEYTVPATGLVIGREVGADVVVPLAEVSRRHAEIVPTSDGYRVTDLSTNGVMVNGERVVQSRVLNRSDVIRVGTEEFRFYADVAKPLAVPAPAPRAEPPSQPLPPAPGASPAASQVMPTPQSTAPEEAPRTSQPAADSAPSMRPAAAAGDPAVTASRTAGEPPRPSGAPLTAEPPRAAAPRRPVPRPAEPIPAAGGRLPFWMWLLIVLAIVAAALVVMG
ncbi:MAG: FHA domain-containing protein [Gemmatimonadaceae bacterium]|nr:FHA domain-containing protein [Gemmatimonadaceae bacterium]